MAERLPSQRPLLHMTTLSFCSCNLYVHCCNSQSEDKQLLTKLRTAIAGGGRSSWVVALPTLPETGVRARPTFLTLPPKSRSAGRSGSASRSKGGPLLPGLRHTLSKGGR